MFVTIYAESKEVLDTVKSELCTSGLVYPTSGGSYFIQGDIDTLDKLENTFKADSENIALSLIRDFPEYPAVVVWSKEEL